MADSITVHGLTAWPREFDHAKIVALLRDDNRLNFNEMARMFGCSRELVRLIARRYLNVSGRERSQSKEFRLPEHEFITDAQDLGLEVAATGKLESVFINKKLCALRKGTLRTPYFVLHPCSAECDFVIYALPDGRWMILPQAACPAKQTMFRIPENIEKGKCGPYGVRHDWGSYINAWHLLGENMEILDAVPKERMVIGAEKYKAVLEKLTTLPEGMALPVRFEKNSDAQSLQSYLFGMQNKKGYSGPRYETKRSKATLYITVGVNGNGA